METAEHREPYESRGSRTDLGAPGGESPPGDSTTLAASRRLEHGQLGADSGRSPAHAGLVARAGLISPFRQPHHNWFPASGSRRGGRTGGAKVFVEASPSPTEAPRRDILRPPLC